MEAFGYVVMGSCLLHVTCAWPTHGMGPDAPEALAAL